MPKLSPIPLLISTSVASCVLGGLSIWMGVHVSNVGWHQSPLIIQVSLVITSVCALFLLVLSLVSWLLWIKSKCTEGGYYLALSTTDSSVDMDTIESARNQRRAEEDERLRRMGEVLSKKGEGIRIRTLELERLGESLDAKQREQDSREESLTSRLSMIEAKIEQSVEEAEVRTKATIEEERAAWELEKKQQEEAARLARIAIDKEREVWESQKKEEEKALAEAKRQRAEFFHQQKLEADKALRRKRELEEEAELRRQVESESALLRQQKADRALRRKRELKEEAQLRLQMELEDKERRERSEEVSLSIEDAAQSIEDAAQSIEDDLVNFLGFSQEQVDRVKIAQSEHPSDEEAQDDDELSSISSEEGDSELFDEDSRSSCYDDLRSFPRPVQRISTHE